MTLNDARTMMDSVSRATFRFRLERGTERRTLFTIHYDTGRYGAVSRSENGNGDPTALYRGTSLRRATHALQFELEALVADGWAIAAGTIR